MAFYTIDIESGTASPSIERFHAGDNGIRSLVFHFIKGGAPFEVPDGCLATLFALLPSGVTVYDSCDIAGDTVEYTVNSAVTAEAGEVQCEIRLTGADAQVLTCASFILPVDPVLQDDLAIEAQPEFSALTEALSRVLEAESDLSEKLDKAEGEEGNAVVFGPDGSIADGGKPAKVYTVPFEGSEAEIKAVFDAMLSETGSYAAVISVGDCIIPAVAGIYERGTSYVTGIYREKATQKNDMKYIVSMTRDGKISTEKEAVSVGVGGAVSSVNGKTGSVVLTAEDVGALPDTTAIPTDEHINGLISTALGVIENGTY